MSEPIELHWQSTPALWAAYRKGQCFCEDCRGKVPVGFGKTKEAATTDLIEQEDGLVAAKTQEIKACDHGISYADCMTCQNATELKWILTGR
jgi:hypothetical protein